MGVETEAHVTCEQHALKAHGPVQSIEVEIKLQEKYKVLMNLAEAQGTVIRKLKLNHLKEKQQLGKASMKLQLQVDELKKSEEKLTQENKKLKLDIDDLKKGHEKLTAGRAELKHHIADLLRTEERNS
ncbi:hypothetical protein D1007_05817 [Hordeum vulgare]|nr:hypothetical protein D1007_05817 [Hordeum vulgare]